MSKQGNIGVTSENIFPVIKKFLYSDHEIFLRELVSNAVDATQKLKTLASVGEFKGELGDLTVQVKFDENTITISDSGGRREYEENDIEWIKFIRRLKETGMHLRDIQKYSELRYCGKSTMPQRMKILEVHRKYVLEQQQKWNEYLQNLDDKIEFYRQAINEQPEGYD